MSNEIIWDTGEPEALKKSQPAQARPPGDIEWDTSLPTPPKQETQRRATTFTGATAEILKGAARGVTALPRLIAEQVGEPVTRAVPENMRPATSPQVTAMRERFFEQIKPSKEASRVEQALGTGTEFGLSALLFPGGAGVKGVQRAAQALGPAIGAAGGEQIGGETGKAIGAIAGGLGGALASRPAVVGPPKPPPAIKQTAQELIDNGIPVMPSQVGASRVTRSIEDLGDRTRIEPIMRQRAQPVLQNLASQETGVLPQNMTKAALDASSKQISQQSYEPIRQLVKLNMTITPHGATPYKQQLSNIAQKYRNLKDGATIAAQARRLRVNSMDADDVLENVRQLRSSASDQFRQDNREYGKALREIADALEDQIENSLPPGSPMLSAYRAGRAQIAKNNAVVDILVDPKTSIIDTTKAFKLREDGVKLTGKLDVIADAGSPVFSPTTAPPIRGEASFPWADVWRGGAVGGPVTLAFGPVAGAAASLAPMVGGMAARRMVASPFLQQSMARGLVRPAMPSLFAGSLERVSPGIFPPLFTQGDQ